VLDSIPGAALPVKVPNNNSLATLSREVDSRIYILPDTDAVNLYEV